MSKLKLSDILKRQKPSKYRSKRTEVDGIKFHSKKEADRYVQLKLLEKAGRISNLRLQERIPIRIWPLRIAQDAEPVLVAHYVADFVYARDGRTVTEDVKGFKTETYKLKKKIVEALYGITVHES